MNDNYFLRASLYLAIFGIGVSAGSLIQAHNDKVEIQKAELRGELKEINRSYPTSAVSGNSFDYLSPGIALGKYEGHCINSDGTLVSPGVYQGMVDGKVASVKCLAEK